MEAEPGRRTGTVSKTDRTARCGGRYLQLPPMLESILILTMERQPDKRAGTAWKAVSAQ